MTRDWEQVLFVCMYFRHAFGMQLSISTCARVSVYSIFVRLCLFNTVLLAATYLVYMSKVRQYTVSCRLLKVYIVDFAENFS